MPVEVRNYCLTDLLLMEIKIFYKADAILVSIVNWPATMEIVYNV